MKLGAVPLINDARGRSPQGERGLKPDQVWPDSVQWNSRSPQGERGLKLTVLGQIVARDIAPRKGSVG